MTMNLDLVPLFLLNPPSRLKALGQALTNVACLLGAVGVAANVATKAAQAVQSIAGVAPLQVSLAQLYPQLPTWWIPESPLGFAFVGVVLVGGLVIQSTAIKVQRLMY